METSRVILSGDQIDEDDEHPVAHVPTTPQEHFNLNVQAVIFHVGV